ncbi:MAG: inositol monophosphatase family protein, partial [Dongiaceae bacterium]
MAGTAIAEGQLLERLARIAEEAGRAILRYYATDLAVRTKSDATPVTDADQAAEAVILEALAPLLPGVPVVAEEAMSGGSEPALGE